ncbi:putative Dol-P-Man:Man(5)GlcNAc(2)-PP-Dol alpha-1,3-mannosyltransferase [Hypsizygus marmoreus]|uniref:Dol-P-Man:Man(5)GlcNAc(2)-PP-Dol alpha-1,3-mannosyltransferase n=1 Tax=Hypsizygus marmoreus TaxID=39966 RepID=A0A369JWL7_HYPMA|nr:putative Dol-P-Man:Man(5)GlcNAc(2)-PP-Dol alpha-1,3-mannosyltransferase [Hypsizygus marmoreus]
MSTQDGLSFRRPVQAVTSILTDPNYFWTLAFLVILGDAVLTELIIRFIPYTEIDWETYMVQTEVFLKGQHNYSMITGPTGPLVYPAGHVRIHKILHDITDSGRNIERAQHIYGALYVATLTLTCAIYRRARTIPNWVILLLPLSKRLHSIFVLRLFNDCWAALAVHGAILLYQGGLDDTATFLFAAALSVKMSILLYLPGLLVILFKRRGLFSTCRHLMTMVAVQTLLASPFLAEDFWAYVNSAFDLSRVFLYKWTVNWRFVDEKIFLSRQWALGLLVGHVSVLVLFGLFKWCRDDGGVWRVLDRGLRQPHLPAGIAPTTADYTATVMFTSNLIGILFARSLHYQFYSWYALQIPFLAWKTPYPLVVKLAVIAGTEYAWNVFPSTSLSSAILLGCNALLLTGVWFGKETEAKAKAQAKPKST